MNDFPPFYNALANSIPQSSSSRSNLVGATSLDSLS
jgi:hypothetical protein